MTLYDLDLESRSRSYKVILNVPSTETQSFVTEAYSVVYTVNVHQHDHIIAELTNLCQCLH